MGERKGSPRNGYPLCARHTFAREIIANTETADQLDIERNGAMQSLAQQKGVGAVGRSLGRARLELMSVFNCSLLAALSSSTAFRERCFLPRSDRGVRLSFDRRTALPWQIKGEWSCCQAVRRRHTVGLVYLWRGTFLSD